MVTGSLQVEANRKTHRQLVARLSQENQFHRQVELNASLRSIQAELTALMT